MNLSPLASAAIQVVVAFFLVAAVVIYLAWAIGILTSEINDVKSMKRLTRRLAYGVDAGNIIDIPTATNLCFGTFGFRDEEFIQKILCQSLNIVSVGINDPMRRMELLGFEFEGPSKKEKLAALSSKIADLTQRANSILPFAGVPAEERILLNDAVAIAPAVKDKMTQLANVIISKDRAYQKFVTLKRWSIPLALLSLIGGFASLLFKFL